MLPENIDDLFRDKLDGHASPPSDDLWARLQAQPSAEPAAEGPDASASRLDQLFRQGLNQHPSTPSREVWERLEDEHLRPRKRRAAAWWPMALAAAVALLLVVGGAGLWLGFPSSNTQTGTVASQQAKGAKPTVSSKANDLATATTGSTAESLAATEKTQAAAAALVAANSAAVAANTAAQTLETNNSVANQKNVTAQATRSTGLASTASKARMSAPGQSPRHPLGPNRQPDAAAVSLPLVARTTPAVAPNPAPTPAADEQRLHPAPAPVVAQNTPSTPTPTAEIVPAGTMITVDVRNGSAAAIRNNKTSFSAVASAEEPSERRGLGGRLLQQAGHLVRGERLSIAEATGLPENVTLRANIAGRSVSKSIQL